MSAPLHRPHRSTRALVTGLLLATAGIARGHDEGWPVITAGAVGTTSSPASQASPASEAGKSTPDGTKSIPEGTKSTPEAAKTTPEGTRSAPDATRSTPAADPNARITARERVNRVAGDLERLRGKPFKAEVTVKVQSAAEFRAYVEKAIDKDLPPEVAARQSATFQAFGLLPRGYDLRKGLADLLVSQAGAYYDPETKAFYILMAGLPDDQMDSLILHELDHALQDQYFDLAGLKETVYKSPNEDTRTALGFLMEGEATYVMLKYQMKKAGQDLDALPPGGQEFVLRMMRDLDRKTLLGMSALSRPKGPEGEEIRNAMDALADVPVVLFWSLHDPYFKGQYAVHQVFAARGWAGVDGLYAAPPASTEQLLHPEKLGVPRDEPVAVTLSDLLPTLGGAWKPVFSNTLGEAGMQAFFDEHNRKYRTRAPEGWGGDQYAVYEGPDGGLLLHWVSVWDQEQEAIEFQEALEGIDKKALGAGPSPGRKVVRDGSRVTVLAGPKAALEKLEGARMK